MLARTARDAVRAFVDPIQQTVSCISREPLLRGAAVDGVSSLTLPSRWLRLPGLAGLQRSVIHAYRVDQTHRVWTVHSAACHYAVADDDRREIAAYHWHPHVMSGSRQLSFPHLHAASTHGIVRTGHVPTGRISIESVIRFRIDDGGVAPLRSDWREVLDRNDAGFVARRTWT